jgi:hypothetical protein
MSRATLELRQLSTVTREAIVDCQHGTSSATVIQPPGGLLITDAALVAVVVEKHYSREHCSCTRSLRRRFGLAAASSHWP